MQETGISFLGWEDPLEKKMATHSSILAWEIPWTEGAWWYIPWCCKRVSRDLRNKQQQQPLTDPLCPRRITGGARKLTQKQKKRAPNKSVIES